MAYCTFSCGWSSCQLNNDHGHHGSSLNSSTNRSSFSSPAEVRSQLRVQCHGGIHQNLRMESILTMLDTSPLLKWYNSKNQVARICNDTLHNASGCVQLSFLIPRSPFQNWYPLWCVTRILHLIWSPQSHELPMQHLATLEHYPFSLPFDPRTSRKRTKKCKSSCCDCVLFLPLSSSQHQWPTSSMARWRENTRLSSSPKSCGFFPWLRR